MKLSKAIFTQPERGRLDLIRKSVFSKLVYYAALSLFLSYCHAKCTLTFLYILFMYISLIVMARSIVNSLF